LTVPVGTLSVACDLSGSFRCLAFAISVLRGAGSSVFKVQPSIMGDITDLAPVYMTDSKQLTSTFSSSAEMVVLANSFKMSSG
jgi:hypothetical protein